MEDSSLRYNPLIEATRFAASLPALKPRRGPLQSFARKLVLDKLGDLVEGELEFVDGRDHFTFGKKSEAFPVRARIDVRDAALYPQMAFGGSIGAAEAFMNGAWQTDDLTSVVRIFVRNRDVLEGMEGGAARALVSMHKLYHRLNENSLTGSKKNIQAHYDLGNDFYELFLDETMMYSAGVFEHASSTLAEASTAKIERICSKLELSARDHVVEIGTGWGGFAVHAAARYGCRVTTTTISRRQYEYAVERVKRLGLEHLVTVLFRDYRELEGTFDKLVSIEMIEAVGHAYYDEFFGRCARLLKPDGLMSLQAITIADRYYDSALRSVDFIQRYIFPGSTIPSVAAISASVARASDLRLVHHEDLTPHYARTLAAWRERFFENIHEVERLGYGERFIRMWEYYLSYCEGGFAERAIGSVQMTFAKPMNRSSPILPSLR